MRRVFLIMCALSFLSACDPEPSDAPPIAPADMADMLDQGKPDLSDASPDLPSEEMGDDMSATPDQDQAHDLSDDADMIDPKDDMTHDADMLDPTDMMADADMLEPTDMMADADMLDPSDMDASQDMDEPDYSRRPRGQCVDTSDCKSSMICDRWAVGGECLGACNTCRLLDFSTTCEEDEGTCHRGCSFDTNCPPGRACDVEGRCMPLRCTNNVCPVPWYGCDAPEGSCVRVPCGAGGSCPVGTQCDRGVCIEDHIRP